MKAIRFVIISILWGCFLWGPTMPVLASNTDDLMNALKTTPQGIRLKDYFVPGTSLNNHAEIVDSQNSAVQATQAVKITDGKGQVGSIWSTADNTFKLNEPQTVSMWLYFGGKEYVDPNIAQTGDGMAFVLQNDPRGTAATTSLPDSLHPGDTLGETLGVWGADTDPKASVPDKIAASAIQRSWAIEFDSFVNKSNTFEMAGKWDSFDANQGLAFPHIAANYPGNTNSYQSNLLKRESSDFFGNLFGEKETAYYTSLKHKGLIQGDNFQFLSDQKWHHFTLHYEPQVDGNTGKAHITYAFDDKDPHTGVDVHKKESSFDLDKSQIDNGKHEARWGFTGATGSLSENNLVVFDQVPDLVDVRADTSMTDMTQDTDVSQDQKVREDDRIKLNYHVQYLGGKTSWRDVVANLKLPTNIDFSAGELTVASDPDGTRTFDASDLSNNELIHPISTSLSASSKEATFTFVGKVKDGTGHVDPVKSQFHGKEAVVETATPEFTVAPTLDLKLTLPSSVTVSRNKAAYITGSVAIENPSWKNSDIRLQMNINGHSFEQVLQDKDKRGQFTIGVPTSFITKKTNKLTITATGPDPSHNSQTETVMIYISELTFTSGTPQVNFKGSVTGSKQQLTSTQPLDLIVKDTRGKGSGWHLEAVASQLKQDDGRSLDGDLQYLKGGQLLSLASAQTIASHINDGVSTTTHISSENNQGLILCLGSETVAGNYTGQISWMLMNTP